MNLNSSIGGDLPGVTRVMTTLYMVITGQRLTVYPADLYDFFVITV